MIGVVHLSSTFRPPFVHLSSTFRPLYVHLHETDKICGKRCKKQYRKHKCHQFGFTPTRYTQRNNNAGFVGRKLFKILIMMLSNLYLDAMSTQSNLWITFQGDLDWKFMVMASWHLLTLVARNCAKQIALTLTEYDVKYWSCHAANWIKRVNNEYRFVGLITTPECTSKLWIWNEGFIRI